MKAYCSCGLSGCSAPAPDHLDAVPVYMHISTPAEALMLSQVKAVIRNPEMLIKTYPEIPLQRQSQQAPQRQNREVA
jgi:hypothetical protein